MAAISRQSHEACRIDAAYNVHVGKPGGSLRLADILDVAAYLRDSRCDQIKHLETDCHLGKDPHFE